MVGQILKLVGFWPPVVYAIMVFTLFWLLDRNAAPQPRRALTNWFAGKRYDKEQVARLILYVFDRFYTSPLFGWRAFLRSAIVSTVATLLVGYQLFPMTWYIVAKVPELGYSIATQLVANIFADYISLFLIRRWLVLAGQRPLLALTTAPLIGMVIVVAVYLVRDVGGFSIQTGTFSFKYFIDDLSEWITFIYNRRIRFAYLVPALVVHLWLPLFALGVIVAKGINSVRAAGSFSQWFFKHGDAHPLRSVGFIASILTFIAVAVGMLYW
jgi:hypothetical protein